MNIRRFALSFLTTGILSSPLLLNADAPKPPKVEIAPRANSAAELKHTKLHVKVLSAKGDTVTVRLTGENKGRDVADAQVAIVLMREAAGSEFSRMAPPPQQVKKMIVPVKLAAGEKFDRVITLTGVTIGNAASLQRRPFYAQVHAASKKEVAQAGTATVSAK